MSSAHRPAPAKAHSPQVGSAAPQVDSNSSQVSTHSPPVSPHPHLPEMHAAINRWYGQHQRDLPWRRPGTSAWAIFLSEVMSQQTPIARVLPIWEEWMRRWPTPADLASATPAQVIAAWHRLGYPRRALRLREAAIVMASEHGNEVPDSYDSLLALPGVGPYTASAVMSFAHGEPLPVLDTNVRRVLARALVGQEFPPAQPTRAERTLAEVAMPARTEEALIWNVAVMELGSLVCTARTPECDRCPVQRGCAWHDAGRPAAAVRPRGQAWAGTDRQLRGELVQVLRDGSPELTATMALALRPDDPAQVERCLTSLVSDGLLEEFDPGRFRLPQA